MKRFVARLYLVALACLFSSFVFACLCAIPTEGWPVLRDFVLSLAAAMLGTYILIHATIWAVKNSRR